MSDSDSDIGKKMEAQHKDYVEATMSSDEYFSDGEASARAASLKKSKQILVGVIGFLFVMVALITYSCQPPKGSIMYGICSAFLEQIVDYPTSIQKLYVEQFPRAVRIYFNQTDAFGQFTQDMIECAADPNALKFTKVLYNRKPVDAQKIEKFNRTIPVIVASGPDLTLPEAPVNMLKSLPRD